jgi:2-polyprenyl-3-methyl-5-hydroxy-6-metoxy-1,4-benzoquinol methylase
MKERIKFESCPLCGSSNLTHFRTGDCSRHALYQPALSAEIHWNKCSACMHVFTEGYYTQKACEIIFSKTHENQKIGFQPENQRIVSSRIVEKILPWVAEGNWLDVGFGNGALLFVAKEYGYTPIGADLRQDNVNGLKSLGIEAYCRDLTKLSFGAKCSVISMADVLEHMPFPKAGLESAQRLLADGGVLFISMPNCEGVTWDLQTRNNVNPYWGEIEHYHNFSKTRLYELLRETGFEPVRYGISERYRMCMEIIAKKRLCG